MVPSLHPQVVKVIRAVKTSGELSKIAGEQAMLAKVAIDAGIFGMANFSVKTASVADPIQDTANKMAELAVSVYGFNKIAHPMSDQEMKAVMGGFNNLGFKDPVHGKPANYVQQRPQGGFEIGYREPQAKTAVVTMNPILRDAISKMATVGAIEGMLNQLPGNVSEETQKLAMEIRALNRGYGVTILNDLLS